jgi:hypothetical protein
VKKLVMLLGLLLGLGLLATELPALGHDTDNARRTEAECKELQDKRLEATCLKCVSNPKPHHFHPLYPAGKRCRPNNGKP